MKEFYSLICTLFCALGMSAQTVTILSEGFEEGIPSSAPSSETMVTLTSGEWKFQGVSVAKDNGSNRAKMSANECQYFLCLCLRKSKP